MLILRKVMARLSRRTEDQREHNHRDVEKQKLDYITFEAVVGRNSRFLVLSADEIEELGGVEYRALTALMWLVAGVSHFESTKR